MKCQLSTVIGRRGKRFWASTNLQVLKARGNRSVMAYGGAVTSMQDNGVPWLTSQMGAGLPSLPGLQLPEIRNYAGGRGARIGAPCVT